MRRLLASGAAVLLGAALMFAPSQAQAMGKVKCDKTSTGYPTVKTGYYDPIVNHNSTGPSAHEHQFFGARGWLDTLANPNTANLGDLRAGPTDCRVVNDTAGYWIPTLRYISGPNTGKLIPVQQFTAYYRPATGVGGPDFGPAVAIPADTRLVGNTYNWTCGQNSGTLSAPKSYIPNCTGQDGSPGHTLTAHIDMPTCWNGNAPNHTAGEVGDTRDNADYAKKSNGQYITKGACPAGYRGVTAIRETFQFDYQGTGADVALSSDMAGMPHGSSLHADFFQSWQEPFFSTTWLDACVRYQAKYTTAVCQP